MLQCIWIILKMFSRHFKHLFPDDCMVFVYVLVLMLMQNFTNDAKMVKKRR